MSKEIIDKNNSKPIQENNLTYAQNENDDQLIEIAAEQFANLFWRQWLIEKESKD